MNYEEAIAHINSISRYGNKPGVECAGALLDKLKHPEAQLRIVHVAGTNGKGSVCAYLSQILMEAGLKVGMFISPHLIRENERIRIQGRYISDDEFESCFADVHRAEEELIEDGFGQISYFDFFFGTAMLHFARNNVDVVVMETGVGGRLDSTNAIQKPVLSVITSVSKDHTAILGDSIEQIAQEKAGIIKSNAPVVYLAGEEYSHIIENAAAKADVMAYGVEKAQCEIIMNTIKYIDFSFNSSYYKGNVFRTATPAEYQAVNASLALMAAWVLYKHCKLADIPGFCDDRSFIECAKRGISRTSWEGRMEALTPCVYIDGAHNPDGIEAMLDSAGCMKKVLGGRMVLLFAAVKDKNYDDMIAAVCGRRIFDMYIATQIDGARCLPAKDIMEDFKAHTNAPVIAFTDIKQALDKGCSLCRDGNTTLICAGSLYLAGKIRRLFMDGMEN